MLLQSVVMNIIVAGNNDIDVAADVDGLVDDLVVMFVVDCGCIDVDLVGR